MASRETGYTFRVTQFIYNRCNPNNPTSYIGERSEASELLYGAIEMRLAGGFTGDLTPLRKHIDTLNSPILPPVTTQEDKEP